MCTHMVPRRISRGNKNFHERACVELHNTRLTKRGQPMPYCTTFGQSPRDLPPVDNPHYRLTVAQNLPRVIHKRTHENVN